MHRVFLSTLVAVWGFFCVMPHTAQAQAYRAVNRLVVIPLDHTSMEVIEDQQSGVRDVWCAAADYVRHRLGDPRNARLFLTVPHGPSPRVKGAKSVSFTIAPDASLAKAKPSYSASLRKVGTNLSVATSYTYCRDVYEEKFFGNR